nr:undecaprenyl-diphosphatase [uncultured Bacillus sp.]
MDEKIFYAINGLAGRFTPLDRLMILISNKTRYVFLLFLVIFWFKHPSHQKLIIHSGKAVILSLLLNTLIKCFYSKPRPFMKRRVGILIPSKTDSSFPSKHTLLSFAVSTSVFLHERLIGSILYGLSFFTGISRIWVGHHYPSDILGSACIGSLSGVIMDKADFLCLKNT